MDLLTLKGMIGAGDKITRSFLLQGYPVLAEAISPAVYFAAVLYWALLGYKIYGGHAALEWREILAKTVMTCGVFGALSWSGLALTIYEIFVTSMESAGGTIMGGKQSVDMLDGLMNNASAIAALLRSGGWSSFSASAEGLLILVVNCVLFVVALVYMAISKYGLAITMLLLPLFVGFAFFEQTRQWFMNWLSMMLNFTFVYILVIAIVRLGFLAFGDYIDAVGNAATFTDRVLIKYEYVNNLLILELILIIFMLQVKGWAAALSGGAAVQGVSGLMRLARLFKGLK